MPILSRWFLRSAIVCLVLALALGVGAAGLLRAPWGPAFAPFALHLLVVGWATQMIFGVAFWMFPRLPPDRSFGSPIHAWTAFTCLNAGLLLRGVFEPWVALHGPAPGTGTALLASAFLQLVAVLAMVTLLWRRVGAR